MADKSAKRNVSLVLQCEWGSCTHVSSRMEDFCTHVSEHLRQHQHEAREEAVDCEDEYCCHWLGCGFFTPDRTDFVRHVYFHCYHTKLKQFGLQALQSQPDLNPCQLDTQTRNIIPELQDGFICLWDQCESSYDNPEWYYRHVDTHGLSAEYEVAGKENRVLLCGWKEHRFQCSHCSKRFATERLLRDHMRNHVNHYKCPLCDMTCPLPSSLRSHIRFRHSDERPFKCQHCEYSCKNLVDLRRHQDTHSKMPAFCCEYEECTFTARSMSSIKAHHRKFHEGDCEPRYKCHVCEKCFTRGNNLTVHLRKKHQFKWPSGHPRFRYKEHDDGFLRLQLVRYESVELTEQLMKEREKQGAPMDTTTTCLVLSPGGSMESDEGVYDRTVVEKDCALLS
ncbi:hypothetical protein XENTR_v10018735 [Xenopus tropicalis]|uniref:Histone H4 transcription factor isoform X1 n=1 Tax=Xenopus tropicalis TaxID=8364 RepID=A0A8J0STP0_XENTR|nr:histone H4 transcription factor isoform X1 [Xenopus tropicalis]KAE8592340.1 hypothetical protein XENTR_v10018735 [Xenopus tropicalis]